LKLIRSPAPFKDEQLKRFLDEVIAVQEKGVGKQEYVYLSASTPEGENVDLVYHLDRQRSTAKLFVIHTKAKLDITRPTSQQNREAFEAGAKSADSFTGNLQAETNRLEDKITRKFTLTGADPEIIRFNATIDELLKLKKPLNPFEAGEWIALLKTIESSPYPTKEQWDAIETFRLRMLRSRR
jgi:hypothetical protein